MIPGNGHCFQGCRLSTTTPKSAMLHRHICAIPHIATYRSILPRHDKEHARKCFAILSVQVSQDMTSIVYRCWDSKLLKGSDRGFISELVRYGSTPKTKIHQKKAGDKNQVDPVLGNYSREGAAATTTTTTTTTTNNNSGINLSGW